MRSLQASASSVVFGFAVVAGSLLTQQSSAHAQVIAPPAPSNPITSRPTSSGSGGIVPTADFLPAYTTTGSVGGSTMGGVESSFGFFFDAAQNVQLDGLGFASQAGWSNGTSY